MMAPRSIALFLTEDCNLRCGYCYVTKRPETIGLDTAIAALEWLVAAAPKPPVTVHFFGGEPMMKWEIMREVIAYGRAKNPPVRFGVTTNGTIWPDDAHRLYADKALAVNFSMDGDRATQDANRPTRTGQGSYATVAATLRRLLAAKRSQNVRMTVDPSCVARLAENVRHVWGLGCRDITPVPVIEAAWTEATLRQYGSQLKQLASDVLSHGVRDYHRLGPLEKWVQKVLRAGKGTGPQRRPAWQCGAGRGYLAVHVDGAVYPCHRFASFRAYQMGHIDGTEDHGTLDTFATWDAVERLPGCLGCGVRLLCAGSCAAVNHDVTGSLEIPAPVACAVTRIQAEVARWFIQQAPSPLTERMQKRSNSRRAAQCEETDVHPEWSGGKADA